MRFTASQIAELTGGSLVGPDIEVDGASIDSRELCSGALFIPVLGERDGHDFIESALSAGAGAYLTARDPMGGTAIVVDDVQRAFSALGHAARRRLPDTVVAVTGSVGKTTTKDLTAATIGEARLVHSSVRSFNNELGVPLTLVNAPDGTEATVLEMGSRGRGHIAELCVVGEPTIGIVTTVDLVHTELFGELDDVATAKAELVEALPSSGIAILNATNDHVMAMAERTDARVLTFGIGVGDVQASAVTVDEGLQATFRLDSPWGSINVRLGVRGAHNVINALAAASAALVCGVQIPEIAAGLSTAKSSPWRMELAQTTNGALVLNDSYNAGPASVEAALRALAHLDVDRRTAVLGPMAELGSKSRDAHRKIAAVADGLGIRLIGVGTEEYGTEAVSDIAEALSALGTIGTGDAVLVKGSRVAGMERFSEALLS